MHKPADLPDDELQRLQTLHDLGILDTEGDEIFDNLTRFASDLFGTPIALVSLVDENRQWFLSHHGIDATETPRSQSFCAHSILDRNNVMVIPDATRDKRFSDNPLVTDNPGIRFYAGAPIVSDDGLPLGTFCIIDTSPRDDFDEADHEKLKHFARMAMREIQLWKARRETEQKLEHLQDSQEEQSRILTLLGHDMKGSFNAIIGFCGLLSRIDPAANPDKLREYVEIIGSASHRAHQLMENLMSWARSGTSGHAGEQVATDIRIPVMGAISTIRPAADIKSVAIIDRTTACIVHIDPVQIEAVIRNLIGNAVKFSHSGGSIEIVTSVSDGRLTLSVRDQGVGMDRRTLERIRNAATGGSATGTAGEKGSGIGLMLSRDFLSTHDAVLQVDSIPGKGSTFSFTVPCEPRDES
ncbi:MAG: GAF domain-containing sensor histidine kinase [Rhodospirillales bacterium]